MRLRPIFAEATKLWPQYAYTTGRSIDHAIIRALHHCSQVQQILASQRLTLRERRHTGRKPTSCQGGVTLSIDTSKAFDTVNRQVLEQELRAARVPEPELAVILNLHHCIGYWPAGQDPTTRVASERGVTSVTWLQEDTTMFADDLLLQWIVHRVQDLENMVDIIAHTFRILAQLGLQVQHRKTQLIVAYKGRQATQWWRAHTATTAEGRFLLIPQPGSKALRLPIVTKLTYLGIILSYVDATTATVDHRLQVAEAQRARLLKESSRALLERLNVEDPLLSLLQRPRIMHWLVHITESKLALTSPGGKGPPPNRSSGTRQQQQPLTGRGRHAAPFQGSRGSDVPDNRNGPSKMPSGDHALLHRVAKALIVQADYLSRLQSDHTVIFTFRTGNGPQLMVPLLQEVATTWREQRQQNKINAFATDTESQKRAQELGWITSEGEFNFLDWDFEDKKLVPRQEVTLTHDQILTDAKRLKALLKNPDLVLKFSGGRNAKPDSTSETATFVLELSMQQPEASEAMAIFRKWYANSALLLLSLRLKPARPERSPLIKEIQEASLERSLQDLLSAPVPTPGERITIPDLPGWHSSLRGWTNLHRQQDCLELIHHLFDQHCPAHMRCQWEARPIPGTVAARRPLISGLFNIDLPLPKKTSSATIQECIISWHEQKIPHGLLHAPPYLLTSLARYANPTKGKNKTRIPCKAMQRVSFPVFRGPGHEIQWATYELVAGILHLGPSPQQGHYRAFLAHPRDAQNFASQCIGDFGPLGETVGPFGEPDLHLVVYRRWSIARAVSSNICSDPE
ncbi:TRPT1 [Symbiodinium sp. CCMP2592]|nr:TRPT1 [Symbiodinium sp. CCMP2592]